MAQDLSSLKLEKKKAIEFLRRSKRYGSSEYFREGRETNDEVEERNDEGRVHKW